MPYTDSPSSTNAAGKRDAVRLLVGDISTSAAGDFLSDNAYDFFISHATFPYGSAILACNALAALNGGRAIEKAVGDLHYKKADAKYYQTLMAEFRIRLAIGSDPYAGGISRSDKQSVTRDLDRTAPAFAKGEFDDPAGMNPQTGYSIQSSTVRY